MPEQNIKNRLTGFVRSKTETPVASTVAVLWQRFVADRLTLTASSLTFTSMLALVPFFAVVLSVFTAFPAFAHLQEALQQWLIESLIPESIADNVMGYLTQFAGKASQLGAAGFAGLTVTSVSLMLTIDKTLNQIWRCNTKRPLGQRVLVYWAALTLGPLLLGASLAITSYLATASRGWLPDLPGGVDLALGLLQFLLMSAALTMLYRYVPNRPVQWRHAAAGAVFVVLGLGLARWGLGLYLSRIPTYSAIYGTFATLPILLLWIYVSWLIVLLGAVIAAYLPSVLLGVVRAGGEPGWDFALATEVLQALATQRSQSGHGLSELELARRLRVEPLQLQPALTALQALGWTGQLVPPGDNQLPRHVLLAAPEDTPLQPLLERLLLTPGSLPGHAHSPALCGRPWAELRVVDVLDDVSSGDAA